MLVEAILLLACAMAGLAFVVKVYQWQRDVLYGPYIDRRISRRRPEPPGDGAASNQQPARVIR